MSQVLRVALPIPLRKTFDYLPPQGQVLRGLQPGARLLVPFGCHSRVGYLSEIVDASELNPVRLKPITAVLDEESLLGTADAQLLNWAASYYHHPLGEVMACAFPRLLRQGRKAELLPESHLTITEAGKSLSPATLKRATRQAWLLEQLQKSTSGFSAADLGVLSPFWNRTARDLIRKGLAELTVKPDSATSPASPRLIPATFPFPLNNAQRQAIQAVEASLDRYSTFLLEGVTGSGKTEVYLRLSQAVLERDKQVMVLLPEISLTPQLEQRFRERFAAPIAVFHSRLTETERLSAWLRIQHGETAILLGTRSAVFIPMKRPGLIIIDEEHDASFKQQEGFRFSARDVAIKKAQYLGIPVVMGSATPSLESLANIARGRYRSLTLPDRAGGAAQPRFRLLDIRNQRLKEGLSPHLISKIESTLEHAEQVLLFLNRRGFAPTLICHGCGWVAQCPRCDARLVIHLRDQRLRCHYCAHEQALPSGCPKCSATDLRPLGLGTERLEQALVDLFPDTRVVRIDRDSTNRVGSLGRTLEQVHSGDVGILLGTQMLAKGHHFPRVTLVGILDVDAMLFATDFRAGERTSQLIVQVAGRAGRAERPGTVVLQTRHPDHPLLRTLIEQGYPGFATAALAERRLAALPPISHMAVWRAEALDDDAPLRFLTDLRNIAAELALGKVLLLGPAPAPMLRQAGRYRYQLAFQSTERKHLHALIDDLEHRIPRLGLAKKVRWSVDIDPIDCY